MNETDGTPEPILRRDDRLDEAKLIPEWRVAADDQIIVIGVGVLLALLAALGWNAWRGDDDGTELVADVAGTVTTVAVDVDGAGAGGAAAAVVVVDDTDDTDTDTDTDTEVVEETDEAAVTTTTEAPTTAPDVTLDLVPPTVAALTVAGVVDAAADADGSTVTVRGVVGNETERDAALEAAAAVDGVDEVIDELTVLQPDVQAALVGSGVQDPEAEVAGTIATVRGVVPSEEARGTALAAAANVSGVTEVIDELVVEVPVTTQLNDLFALEPIQFATGSAEILAESFPTLDEAATILSENEVGRLEVQGYTDVRGDEASNLALSQARAEAVVAYLTDAGIPAESFVAKGYGETTQFGEGETDEALFANRRVRFELLG